MLPIPILIVQAPSTVTLRFQPPIGKPMPNLTVTRMTRAVPGQPKATIVMTMPLTVTATGRKAGLTTLQSKVGNVTVEGPGAEKAREAIVKAAQGKAATIVVDAYNVPESASAPGFGDTSSLGGFQGVVFPQKPVRVGESWTYRLDGSRAAANAAGAKVTGTIPMRYTLKSLSTAGGRRVATLAMSLDGKLNVAAQGKAMVLTMRGSGLATVDAATGVVTSATLKTDTLIPLGDLGEIRQSMELSMKSR